MVYLQYIPKVNRVYPELIAHDIVGVQPMNSPVGGIFGFKSNGYMTFSEYLGEYYPEMIKEDFKDLIFDEFTNTELQERYPVIYQEYKQAEAVFNL